MRQSLASSTAARSSWPFELLLQPLEQGEGVRGRAREAADDLAVRADPADLLRIGLHHRIAHRHLAVAGNDGLAVLLHAEDGRSVPLFHGSHVGELADGCN